MPSRLQDKVAIVTGASSGIGRAIAIAYALEGARVVCADLRLETRYTSSEDESRDTTHERITSSGGEAIFVHTDVSDARSVEELVNEAVTKYGRLDIMVNNAGYGVPADRKPVWETSLDTWEATQRVNSTGVFLGIKYASARMIVQDPLPGGGRGCIINTASVLGLVGTQNAVAYCASKGAVVNLTRAAALDCAKYGVAVNAIAPGFTDSSMTEEIFKREEVKRALEERHPFRGLGTPEDLARVAVFLASDDARWVSGVTMPVDGGYIAR